MPLRRWGILSNIRDKIEGLTHLLGAAAAAGDKGLLALVVRADDIAALDSDDGDYEVLYVNEHGILRTQAQQHRDIDGCDAVTGWTVLGNDTVNLAVTTNHVCGQYALEFDKVDGTDDTVIAGIQKTLTELDLVPYHKGGGFFLSSMYLSSLTDIDYTFLRMGTDSSNYNEWRISVDDLSTLWNSLRFVMTGPYTTVGNGWNSAAVTYIATGVAFLLETDELEDIAVDHIAINTGLQVSADIVAEVSSSVATPNVNILKIGNKVINLGAGNVGTGTIRVTIADDDTNILKIATLTQSSTAFFAAAYDTAIGEGATADVESDSVGVDVSDVMGEVLITLEGDVENTAFDAYVDCVFILSHDGTDYDEGAYETLSFNFDGSNSTRRRSIPLNISGANKIKIQSIKNNDSSYDLSADSVNLYLSKKI